MLTPCFFKDKNFLTDCRLFMADAMPTISKKAKAPAATDKAVIKIQTGGIMLSFFLVN